jgi:broad specificity phosphatase PhoE
MTTVYFARHGKVESPNNLIYGPDAGLGDIGEKQMNNLGEGFARQGVEFSTILTSSVKRALDSAIIIQKCFKNQPKVVTKEGLNAMKISGWEGISFDELVAVGDDFHGDPDKPSDPVIL